MKYEYYLFHSVTKRNNVIRTDGVVYKYYDEDALAWIESEKAKFFVKDMFRVTKITEDEAFLEMV